MITSFFSLCRSWLRCYRSEAELDCLSKRELVELGMTRSDMRYISLHGSE